MRFRYCPDCGALLGFRDLGDDKNVPWCENCAKPWFDMFSTCVISLVYNDNNEVLLLHQDYISNRYANLVSGFMQPGESAEEAARREILEETGIETGLLDFAGTYWFEKKGLLMIGFLAKTLNTDHVLKLSSEVDGAEWHPAEEAIGLVHPAGSVSHTLCEVFLNRLSGQQK